MAPGGITAASLGIYAPEPREAQIPHALQQLTSAVDELEGLVKIAHDRFARATRPTGPMPDTGPAKVPIEVKAPIANTIDILTDRIRNALGSLADLNDRAEA